MLTRLINRVRYGVLGFVLIAFPVSSCLLYTVHEITDRPVPRQPEAPEPSGTLLKSEFRIGISSDYMPLVYNDAKFGVIGVEVDFANQLGKELGKKINFVETPFSQLVQALLEDKVDIIMSGMSITTERAERVSFTDPYLTIGQMALARSKDRSKFPDVQSFSNLSSKVGFVQATTGEMAAKAFFHNATLVPQSTVNDGIAALRNGEIEVFIHDAPTIWRVAGNPNEKDLVGLYWLLTKEPLAWAVRKTDEPLRFALNREIQQWRASGFLNQTLSRWMPIRIW